jgi:hypothetical protein
MKRVSAFSSLMACRCADTVITAYNSTQQHQP